MSRESAFYKRGEQVVFGIRSCSCDTYLGELIETQDKGAQCVGDPLAALHLSNADMTLAGIDFIFHAINENDVFPLQSANPVFTSAGLKRQGKGGGRARFRNTGEARDGRLVGTGVVANGRVGLSRERGKFRHEVLSDGGRVK